MKVYLVFYRDYSHYVLKGIGATRDIAKDIAERWAKAYGAQQIEWAGSRLQQWEHPSGDKWFCFDTEEWEVQGLNGEPQLWECPHCEATFLKGNAEIDIHLISNHTEFYRVTQREEQREGES